MLVDEDIRLAALSLYSHFPENGGITSSVRRVVEQLDRGVPAEAMVGLGVMAGLATGLAAAGVLPRSKADSFSLACLHLADAIGAMISPRLQAH